MCPSRYLLSKFDCFEIVLETSWLTILTCPLLLPPTSILQELCDSGHNSLCSSAKSLQLCKSTSVTSSLVDRPSDRLTSSGVVSSTSSLPASYRGCTPRNGMVCWCFTYVSTLSAAYQGWIQSDLFTTSPLVVLPYTSIQSDLFTTSPLVVLPYTSIQSDLFTT